MQQVSADASRRDFRDAVPHPRHRQWAVLAAVPLVVSAALLCVFPSAASNAFSRFIAPWRPVPRYTFTTIEQLPEQLIVPHGEPVTFTVRLRDDSQRQPTAATAQIGLQPPISADLQGAAYELALPAQIDEAWLSLRVGDVREELRVVPMLRPELASIEAQVKLPAYLERPEPLRKDIRGGALSIVKGSVATLSAVANRPLSSATINDQAAVPAGETIASEPLPIEESQKVVLEWKDRYGLAGLEPFSVAIVARDDETPSISCEDLPRQKVILVSESLNFKARAQTILASRSWASNGRAWINRPPRNLPRGNKRSPPAAAIGKSSSWPAPSAQRS